ncbi:MAG TPA: heme lyase CcmF/NrfE family subunit [Hyphomicrobiales bacterium]|nr:heme lyase CcmF/NrfE family subunit [Hyphomicrobiales bacterium]
MIAESGHYALVLALMLAAVQTVVPFWGARVGDRRLMAIGDGTAAGQFAFVLAAFAALVTAHVTSDFSLVNVYQNSSVAKPLIYKITGVWGNHEGSLLLWVLVLALFGFAVSAFGRNLPPRLKADVLAVQGSIAVAFLLFMLLTSNPFARLVPAPFEGQDLNPLLQDPGLAFHPPMLYIGYVGFSIAFAFAIAALIEGRIDAAWARWVRPWTLAAWIFLTLGIAGGSYWSYYELGWGGFWFWDPVENASLMPWLAGTALLHSALVMEKREALRVWTVLLAILTFGLSLLGTFLVRSGILTSVHSFAEDPARGMFVLMILGFFVGGALLLYAWRAPVLRQGGLFAPVSREGALVLNNILLTAAAATVLVGTLYPLALQALAGDKISVGPPFFNVTFGPLMAALLAALPFGPLLAWKRGDLLWATQRLYAAFGAALLGALAVIAFTTGGPVLAVVGVALAAFVIVGAFAEIAARCRLFDVPLGDSLRRAVGLPRANWGSALAHLGMGVSLLGIVASTAWSLETIAAVKIGQSVAVGAYTLTLTDLHQRKASNHDDLVGDFVIRKGGVVVGSAHPAKESFTTRQMTTTEASLVDFGPSQVYVSLGETGADGTVAVRAQWKPFVLFIWLGGGIMAFAGAVSLSDRRLRVGAPRRARAAQPVRPQAEPAE